MCRGPWCFHAILHPPKILENMQTYFLSPCGDPFKEPQAPGASVPGGEAGVPEAKAKTKGQGGGSTQPVGWGHTGTGSKKALGEATAWPRGDPLVQETGELGGSPPGPPPQVGVPREPTGAHARLDGTDRGLGCTRAAPARSPDEASLACPAQRAGARGVLEKDKAWQAPWPAPGGGPCLHGEGSSSSPPPEAVTSAGRTAGQGGPGPSVPSVPGSRQRGAAGCPAPPGEARTGSHPGHPGLPLAVSGPGNRTLLGDCGVETTLAPLGPAPPCLAPAPAYAVPLRTCCARPLPFSRPPRPSRPSGSAPESRRRSRPRPGARASGPATGCRAWGHVTGGGPGPRRKGRAKVTAVVSRLGAVVAALTFVTAPFVPGRTNDCGELGHVIGEEFLPEGEGRGERPGTR